MVLYDGTITSVACNAIEVVRYPQSHQTLIPSCTLMSIQSIQNAHPPIWRLVNTYTLNHLATLPSLAFQNRSAQRTLAIVVDVTKVSPSAKSKATFCCRLYSTKSPYKTKDQQINGPQWLSKFLKSSPYLLVVSAETFSKSRRSSWRLP